MLLLKVNLALPNAAMQAIREHAHGDARMLLGIVFFNELNILLIKLSRSLNPSRVYIILQPLLLHPAGSGRSSWLQVIGLNWTHSCRAGRTQPELDALAVGPLSSKLAPGGSVTAAEPPPATGTSTTTILRNPRAVQKVFMIHLVYYNPAWFYSEGGRFEKKTARVVGKRATLTSRGTEGAPHCSSAQVDTNIFSASL